jgi:hypothetical protein
LIFYIWNFLVQFETNQCICKRSWRLPDYSLLIYVNLTTGSWRPKDPNEIWACWCHRTWAVSAWGEASWLIFFFTGPLNNTTSWSSTLFLVEMNLNRRICSNCSELFLFIWEKKRGYFTRFCYLSLPILLFLVCHRCWPKSTCWTLEGGILQNGPWWQGTQLRTQVTHPRCVFNWIYWAVLFLCMCRKLLFYLEHIHLEGPGLKGVAGGNQKQNIPYVLSFFLLTDTPHLSLLLQSLYWAWFIASIIFPCSCWGFRFILSFCNKDCMLLY